MFVGHVDEADDLGEGGRGLGGGRIVAAVGRGASPVEGVALAGRELPGMIRGSGMTYTRVDFAHVLERIAVAGLRVTVSFGEVERGRHIRSHV